MPSKPSTRLRLFLFAFPLFLFGIFPAAAQESSGIMKMTEDAPNILLRAVERGIDVRYSAALIKPSDLALEEVYVEVKLPDETLLIEAFETPQMQFMGVREDADGKTLIWMGDAIGETVDIVTFAVAGAIEDDMEVYYEWAARDVFSRRVVEAASFIGKPNPLTAAPSVGELILGAAGTEGALLPVGNTGVFVGAAPNLLEEGTRLIVSELPAEANPPPDLDPDIETLWWCAVVQIDNIPEDGGVSVVVPLRRALAPFTPVALFNLEADGTWLPIAAQGIVSADGMTLAYIHTGGTIAAGVDVTLEPQIADIVATPPEMMRGIIALDGEITDAGTAAEMIATVFPDLLPEATFENVDSSNVFAFPVCDEVSTMSSNPVPCVLFPGVYRQCLPGYVNCIFNSVDFGTCFDAGILGLEDDISVQCVGEADDAGDA